MKISQTKLLTSDWCTIEKDKFSIYGIQARNICPNGARCKTPKLCNLKQHIHPKWLDDLLIEKDGRQNKLCTYFVAEGSFKCTRKDCWYVHQNLELVWEHYRDFITEENSVDSLTGLPMSKIITFSINKQIAPRLSLRKNDKWLSVDCGSESSECNDSSEEYGEESPPPADKRDVKDILKEHGYSITNNDAYSREEKPHCHVVFDSEKNCIEKAFFTFDHESEYKNFKLFDNGILVNTDKKLRKLPKYFEAQS